ncbi:tRNA (adenine(22)-N(1))-methyltransferase [Enterococcus timonensis]|uniref:tRNA (adenine(22)-N(1))-methyltransferase n=1 Tax=Enterococcus timonensis TaxID=1852364 RepID=UPI0008D90CD6|nr:tRNA (adenine(22)-N(1))-methyltransferase TrmK [Enterococcus timonensis]
MNERNLSKRLQMVADLVPRQSFLADIGSDHGYLPVHLLLNQQIIGAICGEVAPGPFAATKKEIEKAQMTEKISVRLADGLAAIFPADPITAITICGMGGKLIADILEAGINQLRPEMTLVLQPNNNQDLLRHWLSDHKYELVQENITEENGKIYEVMVAKKNPAATPLKENEIFFGPLLLKEKSEIFIKKWRRNLQTKEKILAQLKTGQVVEESKIARFQQEIQWIKEWIK